MSDVKYLPLFLIYAEATPLCFDIQHKRKRTHGSFKRKRKYSYRLLLNYCIKLYWIYIQRHLWATGFSH